MLGTHATAVAAWTADAMETPPTMGDKRGGGEGC